MKPVSPVVPEHNLNEVNFKLEGCDDLPAVIDDKGGVTTRWSLTPEEIEQVVRQGYIYVHQQGAAHGVHPIWIGVDSPIAPLPDEAAGDSDHDPVLEATEIDAGGGAEG